MAEIDFNFDLNNSGDTADLVIELLAYVREIRPTHPEIADRIDELVDHWTRAVGKEDGAVERLIGRIKELQEQAR